MSPLDVQCLMCGAKPGWRCIGAPNTSLSGCRIPPHQIRVEDAKARPFTPGEELMYAHGIEVVR